MHETINALFGTEAHVYDDAVLREKAVAIIKHLKDAVNQWADETGYGFSLYATPSENLCSRFCRIDTKEFGLIEGVTDKGYYTNSFHLTLRRRLTLTTRSTSRCLTQKSQAVASSVTVSSRTCNVT